MPEISSYGWMSLWGQVTGGGLSKLRLVEKIGAGQANAPKYVSVCASANWVAIETRRAIELDVYCGSFSAALSLTRPPGGWLVHLGMGDLSRFDPPNMPLWARGRGHRTVSDPISGRLGCTTYG